MKKQFNLIIILAFFSVSSFSFAQKIADVIQPLHLTAGQKDSILISDVFYSENYNGIDFFSDENIKVNYSKNSEQLYLSPSKNFEGLGLVKFKFKNHNYSLPFFSNIKEEHTFKFNPNRKIKSVNLFGNFNSWNRNNLQMKDEDNDGVYEISIQLEPGTYEYKFFVDGEEILDPENPEKRANGLGGFNSIITIPKRHAEKSYLHILNKSEDKNNFQFAFYYDKANQKDSLTHSDIITLIDNQKFPDDQINILNNKISLNFKKDKENHLIRIAVNQNGQTTNIQSVFINSDENDSQLKNPFNEMIIYSLLTDRFYNGDKNNDKPIVQDSLSFKANYQGGDFEGIIDKLNGGYFDSLGINTIWIFPVNDNPNDAFREYPPPHRYFTGYHGYWPISSTRVEEHFGNMELFKKLVNTAHQHGIKVLLDFVSHHVHIEDPYWKNHRDWFGKLELPNGKLNLRLWDEHRLTTWFEPYMPSFNYVDSKEALDTMTNNAVWWIKETGVDGFRHDAVKHVPNIFWRTLTSKINKEIEIPQNKKIYQIGETFGSYDLVSSYVNNGQLNAQFNFNLYNTAIPAFLNKNSSFKSLDNELQKTFSVYGVNNLMGNIMDSHDKVRYMAYADGDISLGSSDDVEIGWHNPPEVNHESSYEKARLYLAYLLTIPGIPVIYYGDEIGMTGAADPDNRRMMRFDNKLSYLEKNNLKDVEKLIKIRKNNSALNYGDFQTLQADTNCFIYLRSDFNERILTALNKSDSTQLVSINLPKFYDIKNSTNLFDGNKSEVINNKITFLLSPNEFKIFKLH